MLYAVDGKAVSRASTTDKLAPELEALPALGQTANINMEQLLDLIPDVVLGLVNQHKKYESQLQSNNIPAVLFNYDGIKMCIRDRDGSFIEDNSSTAFLLKWRHLPS